MAGTNSVWEGPTRDMTPEEWNRTVQDATTSVAPPRSGAPVVAVSPPAQRPSGNFPPPEQSSGAAIARQIEDQARQAYKEGGVGAALGEGARGYLASRVGYLNDFARASDRAMYAVTDPPARVLQRFVTGESESYPASAAAATTSGPKFAGRDTIPSRDVGDRGAGAAPPDYGPGVSYTVPKPNAYPAGAPEGGVAQNDERLARMRDELAMYGARDRADEQGRIQAMGANANLAAAWTAQRDAESKARVANWRATNGADMVLASSGKQYEGQRAGILAEQAGANADLKIANENLLKAQGGLTGQPRNYIDEAARSMNAEGVSTASRARTTEAQGSFAAHTGEGALHKAQAEGFKISNEQHRKIMELSDAMGKTTNPQEIQKLERQMLALAGKSPDNWGIERINDADQIVNGLPVKGAQRLFLYNKGTKEYQEITAGAATSKPTSVDDQTLKSNAGNKDIRAGYVSRFGEAEAKRVLGEK